MLRNAIHSAYNLITLIIQMVGISHCIYLVCMSYMCVYMIIFGFIVILDISYAPSVIVFLEANLCLRKGRKLIW